MNEQIKCPICGLDAKKEIIECKTNRIKCPVCKTFNIGDIFDIPSLTEDEKVKLRYYYYILDERDKNRLFSLTSDNKEKFLSKIISPNTLIDKIDNLIKYLADKTKFYGEPVLIPRLHGYRLFFCRDEKELQHILQEIKKLGFGLMRLPQKDGQIDIEQTKTMVDMFLKDGFTYFDTAWAYNGSEEAIRQALVERYPRESFQ